MILRERLSPHRNTGLQQTLQTEFDLLTFDEKEDINAYLEKLRDYQFNLETTTLSISDAALSSKVLSSLPLTWRAQIRHFTDSGMATWASIEKSLRNIQAEQKNIGSKPASRAFAVSKKNNKDKRRKNQDGHGKKDKKGPRNTTNLQCWYCARKGHTHDNCNFKKVTDKLREKNTEGKKPASNAATSDNDSSSPSYAFMAR